MPSATSSNGGTGGGTGGESAKRRANDLLVEGEAFVQCAVHVHDGGQHHSLHTANPPRPSSPGAPDAANDATMAPRQPCRPPGNKATAASQVRMCHARPPTVGGSFADGGARAGHRRDQQVNGILRPTCDHGTTCTGLEEATRAVHGARSEDERRKRKAGQGLEGGRPAADVMELFRRMMGTAKAASSTPQVGGLSRQRRHRTQHGGRDGESWRKQITGAPCPSAPPHTTLYYFTLQFTYSTAYWQCLLPGDSPGPNSYQTSATWRDVVAGRNRTVPVNPHNAPSHRPATTRSSDGCQGRPGCGAASSRQHACERRAESEQSNARIPRLPGALKGKMGNECAGPGSAQPRGIAGAHAVRSAGKPTAPRHTSSRLHARYQVPVLGTAPCRWRKEVKQWPHARAVERSRCSLGRTDGESISPPPVQIGRRCGGWWRWRGEERVRMYSYILHMYAQPGADATRTWRHREAPKRLARAPSSDSTSWSEGAGSGHQPPPPGTSDTVRPSGGESGSAVAALPTPSPAPPRGTACFCGTVRRSKTQHGAEGSTAQRAARRRGQHGEAQAVGMVSPEAKHPPYVRARPFTGKRE
ncbi:hypothetical protein RJ55_02755 [Drechmeria coniospora]|nr:hypothetical protein RJ55_02755 [Drechmeria coniospora]